MTELYSDIEKKLDRIDNLPTLPTLASQLLELLGKTDVSMNQISKLMTVDPAITAKVLKIANSAYYGLRKKVDTLRMALVVLGVNEVSNIILGISLFKVFDNKGDNQNFNHDKFWEHSAVTGHICRYLAKKLGIRMHGEEFTAGLLHDIGKIILDQYFHETFNEALITANNSGEALIDAEQLIVGTNHCEIGSWLAAKWKIPAYISEAIMYHHKPEKANINPELTAIVSLGDLFAKANGVNLTNEEDVEFKIKYSSAWKILKPYTRGLDLVEFNQSLHNEIITAKELIEKLKS
jgi:putative nucleotidyltransferase with HDIG domain